jgi:hypothetical protein
MGAFAFTLLFTISIAWIVNWMLGEFTTIKTKIPNIYFPIALVVAVWLFMMVLTWSA